MTQAKLNNRGVIAGSADDARAASLRIGSLCTGYAGLDAAVQAVIGGEHAWMAENDPHASKVLAHHWPAVPNHGDITAIDWAGVEPVDIIAAGTPCQDISQAGPGEGISGKRSGIWKNAAEAIRVLRPGLVVLENVAAIRSRGLNVVAADLAEIGYDAVWTCLRASDVGAPHKRDRWFALAYPATPYAQRRGWDRWAWDLAETYGRDESADCGDAAGASRIALLPTPAASNPNDGEALESWYARRDRNKAKGINGNGQGMPLAIAAQMLAASEARWVTPEGVDYGPAVRRWEAVIGRPAPEPTEPGTKGNQRLSPLFSEWMMGLPLGHVTAVSGVPRRHQIRVLGGGVVPHQGIAAIESMLPILAGSLGLGVAA